MDVNPEEVAVAVLLADAGELLLWLYAPELPQAARDVVHLGVARRSSQAQTEACGFDFKQLTLRCIELWKLPPLMQQLLRGVDNSRANLTRICSNVARHIVEKTASSDLALASDLLDARKLMPMVSIEALVAGLVMLSAEQQTDLIAKTRDLEGFDPVI